MDLCHPFQCFHGLLSNQVFVSTILVVFAEYAHIVQTQSIKLLALYSICTLKKMARSLSSQVNHAKNADASTSCIYVRLVYYAGLVCSIWIFSRIYACILCISLFDCKDNYAQYLTKCLAYF